MAFVTPLWAGGCASLVDSVALTGKLRVILTERSEVDARAGAAGGLCRAHPSGATALLPFPQPAQAYPPNVSPICPEMSRYDPTQVYLT